MTPSVLAQINLDPSILIQYGVLGIVLLWFMFRLEKKLDRHTSVINDLVESIALDVISRDHVSEHVKGRAEGILSRSAERARSLPTSEVSSVQ